MDELELAALCSLHSIRGIGNRTIWKIKDGFGTFQQCYSADARRLYASFLAPEMVKQIINFRKADNLVDYLNRIRSQNIKVVCVEEPEYPQMLRTIADPPYVLYYTGNINIADKVCIAVVGSRAASPYGRNMARKFGQELAYQDIVVVSGMARGIDTEAHRGALDKEGKTIAVLGSGLNIVYPRENEKLFQQIRDTGLVVSEFPPATIPEPGNFPMRNRIISGLSRGVLVVEAKKKSGALITADFALEQGRDVFAVPGAITSKNCEGTNNLIKQGAKMVTCWEDILEEYYDIKIKANSLPEEILFQLDNNERIVIQCMGYEPIHFDLLMKMTGMDIGTLSTVILGLELRGLVKAMPGNFYVLI